MKGGLVFFIDLMHFVYRFWDVIDVIYFARLCSD